MYNKYQVMLLMITVVGWCLGDQLGGWLKFTIRVGRLLAKSINLINNSLKQQTTTNDLQQ